MTDLEVVELAALRIADHHQRNGNYESDLIGAAFRAFAAEINSLTRVPDTQAQEA